jgi:hypothetical protein
VYSVAGEFARVNEWGLIDLDTGGVTMLHTTKGQTQVAPRCALAPVALDTLRKAAITLWRTKRPRRFVAPPPGVVVDTYIVSGSNLRAYNPFQPEDKAFAALVEKTLSNCQS